MRRFEQSGLIRPLFLIILVLMCLCGAVLAYALQHDPGYVMVAWGDHVFVSGLLIGIVLLVFSVLLIWSVLQLMNWLLDSSRKKPHKTTQGLIELAEGNWETAEKRLYKSARKNKQPLINYLSAARAAQEQGADDRRDYYLKQAHEVIPGADIAISLTQARLQFEREQWEKCLATLTELRKRKTRKGVGYNYVLKLLARVYLKLDDWKHLSELLPELKKRTVFVDSEYQHIERQAHVGLIASSGHNADDDDAKRAALTATWQALPKRTKHDAVIVTRYVRMLVALARYDEAERVLKTALKKHWNDHLVDVYGELKSDRLDEQRVTVEAWLKERPNDARLLIAAARINASLEAWEPAKTYYETALSQRKSPEAYAELGCVLNKLGDLEASNQSFQEGLKLSSDQGELMWG